MSRPFKNYFYSRMADQEIDQNVQVFKIKRLIRNLEKARGNGTSMISLIIPPKEQIAKQQKVISFYKTIFTFCNRCWLMSMEQHRILNPALTVSPSYRPLLPPNNGSSFITKVTLVFL